MKVGLEFQIIRDIIFTIVMILSVAFSFDLLNAPSYLICAIGFLLLLTTALSSWFYVKIFYLRKIRTILEAK